jgi:chemotaxis protein methyltransferase CheR
MENINVTDEEVSALAHAILKRHGIDFTCYEPKSLRRRIIRAISVLGYNSIHEMWVQMLRDQNFIHKFMDEISVGLTSMFRDPIVWKKLKGCIPKIVEQNGGIDIWHAGCSTGEEVYTMGMVLDEVNVLKKARAFASDISQEAINTARRGEYHKIKLAEYEKNYKEFNVFGSLEKYYSRTDNTAIFSNHLIGHVDFRYHNLITDQCTGRYDVIFCRNVMIYFDNTAKVKLMERFHKVLKPGGLFVIGFYDALLPMLDPNLFEVVDVEAKILRAK